MGVAGAGHIFGRGRELHGHAIFADHLADLRADHVDAEDLVGGGIGQHLHKALALMIDLGAAIGGEGELARLIGDASGLQLFLILADPGHFREGVDDAGDQIIVHVTGLARDQLDAGHAVILGLVGQHGAIGGVTDDPDTRGRGLEMVIGDEAALVRHDPDRLEAQTIGKGTTANGHQNIVCIQRLSRAARRRLNR